MWFSQPARHLAPSTGPAPGRAVLPATLLLTVGASVACGLAAAWLGEHSVLVVLAAVAGVVVLLVGLTRPTLAVLLVPATAVVGNMAVPGAGGLQLVQLATLLALGVVVLYALGRPEGESWRPPRAAYPALVAVLAYVLSQLLATVFSVDLVESAKQALTLLLGAGLAAAMAWVVQERADLRLLCLGFILGSIGVSARAVTQGQAAEPQLGGVVVDNRATGALSHPNELGSFAVLVIALSVAALVAAAGWLDRLVAVTGALSGAAALVVSYSRGAWLAGLVAVVAFLVLYPPAWRRLVRLAAVLTATLGLLLALGLLRVPAALSARFDAITAGQQNPYDARPLIWAEGFRLFWERPWFGWGPGTFLDVSATPPSRTWANPAFHAHNGLLTVAVESGLFGAGLALLVVGVVFVLVRRAVRTARRVGRHQEAALAAGALAALVGLAAHFTIDYTLRNPLMHISVWFVVGIALAAARLLPRGPATNHRKANT